MKGPDLVPIVTVSCLSQVYIYIYTCNGVCIVLVYLYDDKNNESRNPISTVDRAPVVWVAHHVRSDSDPIVVSKLCLIAENSSECMYFRHYCP